MAFAGSRFFYGEDATNGSLFVGKARGVPGFSYDFAAVHKTLLDAEPGHSSKFALFPSIPRRTCS